MSDMTISFCVLAGVVVLFVSNRIPVELVAIGAALTLYATGVLSLDEAIGGFGDASVIFIATLFGVREGLDATGVTAWAGQQMVRRVAHLDSSRTGPGAGEDGKDRTAHPQVAGDYGDPAREPLR